MKHAIHLSDEAGTLNPDCIDCKAMIKGFINPLEELVSLCKGEVSVQVNTHTSTYEEIHDWLKDMDALSEITRDEYDGMVLHKRVVWVQAYPVTPIGFYRVFHWDIETAIKKVLEAVKEEKNHGRS